MSAPSPHRLRLTDAIVIATAGFVALDWAFLLRTSAAARGIRQHLAYVAGYHLILAALCLAFVVASAALARRLPRWTAPLAAGAVATPLCFLLLTEDLQRFGLVMRLLIALTFAAVPLVLGAVALWHTRRWFIRLACLGLALALALANQFLLEQNYPGFHVLCVLFAQLAGGVGLAGLALPRRLRTPRPLRAALYTLLLLIAGWSLVVPPSDRVSVRLGSDDAASLYRFVSELHEEDPLQDLGDGLDNEFYRVRTNAPPVPAGPPLVPRERLNVVILSVDALRNDVAEGKHDAKLRAIAELRESGTVFDQAFAPATSTSGTMSALFTGRYYSQIEWEKVEINGKFDYKPVASDSVRFPGLLTAAGVDTFLVSTHWRIAQAGRMTGGFAEERNPDVTDYREASEALPALLEWLKQPHKGPVFAFCHLIDAHAPYDLGGKSGQPFDRYLREIEVVDKELRKFLVALKRTPMWRNTVVILMADHGEAFGEHGQKTHGGYAYEELLHIPLVIRVPGDKPRTISEVVSLIDLGPTILDLFGVETPGNFMGQSLVPLLRGEPPDFKRPVGFHTARGQYGIVFPDRIKALYAPREKRREVYDLKTDLGETQNLVDEAWAKERIAQVRAFFKIHAFKAPGYKPPMH